jgi:hypothetical protein
VEDAPLPIPYREIILTARIMDSIFVQLNAQTAAPVSPRQNELPQPVLTR